MYASWNINISGSPENSAYHQSLSAFQSSIIADSLSPGKLEGRDLQL